MQQRRKGQESIAVCYTQVNPTTSTSQGELLNYSHSFDSLHRMNPILSVPHIRNNVPNMLSVWTSK